MRTLVTFILRLWVDPQAEEPTWEGQVECVTNGERVHVRCPENVLDFIESHTNPAKEPFAQEREGQNNER